MNLAPESKILIQGICEHLGSISIARMQAGGTQAIAGVSPGRGGEICCGIPTFDLVDQAIAQLGEIDTSIILAPACSVLDAALEAIAAGIRQIIIVTEGVPPLDMAALLRQAEATGTSILGSGSTGIIIPDRLLLGVQESQFYTPGGVALISRCCRSISYEVALALNAASLGESISIDLGSDDIVGSSFIQWLPLLAADPNTKAIALVTPAGSKGDEATAQFIAEKIDKPVVAYLIGRANLAEKSLSDGQDLGVAPMPFIASDSHTAQAKVAAFKQAKIPLADSPAQVAELLKKVLKK